MSATLFVPGSPGGEAEWHRALEAQGFAVTGGELSGGELPFRADLEWVENPSDGSFADAFSFGTTSDAHQRTIEASPGALVLSCRSICTGSDRRSPSSDVCSHRLARQQFAWSSRKLATPSSVGSNSSMDPIR